MEKHELVETMGRGPGQQRRLAQPEKLLDMWADAWVKRKEEHHRGYVYLGRSQAVDNFMSRMLENPHHENWALTGAAAANAVIPHLTTVEMVNVMVPPGRSEYWINHLMLERTDIGANVTLVEREGAAVMFLEEHPERPGCRFASRFIQYLDLLDGYGRNKELAAEYRMRALEMEPRDGR